MSEARPSPSARRCEASDGWLALWRAALATFIAAGVTGLLFRWWMLRGFPVDVSATNVRHGHSHLMMMGWAAPALMALIGARTDWSRAPNAERMGRWAVRGSLVIAILAFGAFLGWGYQPVAVGAASLPIAAVISGVAVLAWYLFVCCYGVARRGPSADAPTRLVDGAIVLLVLSSLGAWGEAAAMAADRVHPFWPPAMLRLFVDLFADGWVLLATLALLFPRGGRLDRRDRWALWVYVVAIAPTFVITLDPSLVPVSAAVLGHAGIGISGIALGVLVAGRAAAIRRGAASALWALPLGLLGLKAVAMTLAASPMLLDAALAAGVRLPYLHLLFVGVMTPTLVVAAQRRWGADLVPGAAPMIGACALLFVTLIPLTGLWPGGPAGRWAWGLAMVVGAFPIVAATATLVGRPSALVADGVTEGEARGGDMSGQSAAC